MPEYITIQIDDDGVGQAFGHVKKQIIVHCLTRTRGNVYRAAALLGIASPTVRRYIRDMHLGRLLANLRQRCPKGARPDEDLMLASDADHLPVHVHDGDRPTP